MKILSPSEIVQMFLEAGEEYGFAGMFEGTFGGRLLHDETRGEFLWLTDQEHEEIQETAANPSVAILRSLLDPHATVHRIPAQCREPDDIEDIA